MAKLIGFMDMTKRKGKVIFISEKIDKGGTGEKSDKLFLYDDLSDKVKPDSVGKEIQITYGRGYSGNAYVADVIIK